jgi:hypothetical protein
LDYFVEEYQFNGWSENGVEFLHFSNNQPASVVDIDFASGLSTTLGTVTPTP